MTWRPAARHLRVAVATRWRGTSALAHGAVVQQGRRRQSVAVMAGGQGDDGAVQQGQRVARDDHDAAALLHRSIVRRDHPGLHLVHQLGSSVCQGGRQSSQTP